MKLLSPDLLKFLFLEFSAFGIEVLSFSSDMIGRY